MDRLDRDCVDSPCSSALVALHLRRRGRIQAVRSNRDWRHCSHLNSTFIHSGKCHFRTWETMGETPHKIPKGEELSRWRPFGRSRGHLTSRAHQTTSTSANLSIWTRSSKRTWLEWAYLPLTVFLHCFNDGLTGFSPIWTVNCTHVHSSQTQPRPVSADAKRLHALVSSISWRRLADF
jgi:hypothetical protein